MNIVETRSGIKMLHVMQAPTRWSLGEIGSLVVSIPILPRCRIGDTILAFRSPGFRCIGRDKWWTPLRYAWDEFQMLNILLPSPLRASV
jgi:hypothetical protein